MQPDDAFLEDPFIGMFPNFKREAGIHAARFLTEASESAIPKVALDVLHVLEKTDPTNWAMLVRLIGKAFGNNDLNLYAILWIRAISQIKALLETHALYIAYSRSLRKKPNSKIREEIDKLDSLLNTEEILTASACRDVVAFENSLIGKNDSVMHRIVRKIKQLFLNLPTEQDLIKVRGEIEVCFAKPENMDRLIRIIL